MTIPTEIHKDDIIAKIGDEVTRDVKESVQELIRDMNVITGAMRLEGGIDVEYEAEVTVENMDITVDILEAVKRQDLL